MPYIKIEYRARLDGFINRLSTRIDTAGDLNYVITKLLNNEVTKKGECYATYNTLMGVLTCASNEFYRRKVSIYEDKKIQENGDV